MRCLLLVLALQTGAIPVVPPDDPAVRAVGIWVGVARVEQRGECRIDGHRVYSRPAVLAIRRESDGRLTAISRSCPEMGCVFEDSFEMVWQSPMPDVAAHAPK